MEYIVVLKYVTLVKTKKTKERVKESNKVRVSGGISFTHPVSVPHTHVCVKNQYIFKAGMWGRAAQKCPLPIIGENVLLFFENYYYRNKNKVVVLSQTHKTHINF